MAISRSMRSRPQVSARGNSPFAVRRFMAALDCRGAAFSVPAFLRRPPPGFHPGDRRPPSSMGLNYRAVPGDALPQPAARRPPNIPWRRVPRKLTFWTAFRLRGQHMTIRQEHGLSLAAAVEKVARHYWCSRVTDKSIFDRMAGLPFSLATEDHSGASTAYCPPAVPCDTVLCLPALACVWPPIPCAPRRNRPWCSGPRTRCGRARWSWCRVGWGTEPKVQLSRLADGAAAVPATGPRRSSRSPRR